MPTITQLPALVQANVVPGTDVLPVVNGGVTYKLTVQALVNAAAAAVAPQGGTMALTGALTVSTTLNVAGLSTLSNLTADASTLGVTRIRGADASSPILGVSGTTKGIRFQFSSTASSIEAVDNTLAGSFQPLLLVGSSVGAFSSGTGAVTFGTNNGTPQAFVTHTASAVNSPTFTGGATGSPARIGTFSAVDANPDLLLAPQGTGVLRFGTLTGSADAPVNGYITIKTAAGATIKLATIA